MTFVCSNRQRRVACRWYGSSCNVSSLLDKNPSNLNVAPSSRLHKRCQTGLRPVLQVGLAVGEESNDFVTALEAGQCESRVSVGFDVGIDISSLFQKQKNTFRVTVHRRQHQRRDSQLAAGARVDLGAVLQQQADYVDVAAGSRLAEGRVIRDIAVLLVGASFEE